MSNIAARYREGTTADISTVVLKNGHTQVDISKHTLVVHDGITPGGFPLAKETHSHLNATTNTAGFMSPADKQKIDELALSGGYDTILNNAVPIQTRTQLNFSSDFLVIDDPTVGHEKTDVSVSQALKDEMDNSALAYAIALS